MKNQIINAELEKEFVSVASLKETKQFVKELKHHYTVNDYCRIAYDEFGDYMVYDNIIVNLSVWNSGAPWNRTFTARVEIFCIDSCGGAHSTFYATFKPNCELVSVDHEESLHHFETLFSR